MHDFYRVQHPIFGTYSTRVPSPDDVVLEGVPATDDYGFPLPPDPHDLPQAVQAAHELTGDALKQALVERGLPNTGTADEKRAAVAAHDAGLGVDPNPEGGQPDEQTQEV